MRRRLAGPALLGVPALLLVPALAHADVPLMVPTQFLGAPLPVLRPTPRPLPTGAVPLEKLTPKDFARAAPPGTKDPFMPDSVKPSISPPLPNSACRGLRPVACTVYGPSARVQRPAPVSPQVFRVGVGKLDYPKIGTWLLRERTVLQWEKIPDAAYYNVQVFWGRRRVMNSWPTGTKLKVPNASIDQGRYYLWVVWPGFGPRKAKTFGPPIGRSIFGVVLRPRIVFRPIRGQKGRSEGEVRPHIPFADIALYRPLSLAGRIPGLIRLDGGGRFRINTSPRNAETLEASLVDRGPRPPSGLNGPLPPS